MLLSTGLVLTLAAAPVPQRFCEAWKRAAPKAASYEDALAAAAEATRATGPWTAVLERLFTLSPADHFRHLQAAAKEQGTSFTCPEFEFPRGKPEGTAVLTGDVAAEVMGLAADERGLTVLTCPKGRCELHAVEGGKARVIARDLGERPGGAIDDPGRVLVAGDEAWVVVSGAILAVTRETGKVRRVVSGLSRPHHLSLDGDRLWFADGEAIKSVARAGGAVTTAFAGGAPGMGSKEPVWFKQVPGGVAFVTWEGPLLLATADAVKPVTSPLKGLLTPAGLEGALYVLGADQRLVRLDPTTGASSPVTSKPLRLDALVTGRGELLATSAGQDWRTPPALLAWPAGASDFVVLVKNAGTPRSPAANRTSVWWFDEGQRAVLVAPRK
jgi:hypothetical protein